MRRCAIHLKLEAHFMFKAQMFQKNHNLFILEQKPTEPLNLKRSRMREGDFLLHVPPERPEKLLYQIQSNQLAFRGHLQNESLIKAAENGIENGAKHFKQALWAQTTNTPLILCSTITPRCFLDITPAELKTLINACRLLPIIEELDDLDDLDMLDDLDSMNRKLPCEDTSPLTISYQHSPVYQKHEQHHETESVSAAYRV